MSHVSEFLGRNTNINHTGLENVFDDDLLSVLTGSILSLGSQFLHCEEVSQQADTQQDNTSLGALTWSPHLEPILRINQNGFRSERSTTSHILAFGRILEGAQAKNLSAVMLFIDFKKAFDSVYRGLLMKILRAYGLPDDIVCFIERMYNNTIATVITEDGLTEAFQILAGVMQGDTLAPYLFVITVDYIMLKATEGDNFGFTLHPRRSRRHPEVYFSDTDFADDLALLTNTIALAHNFLLGLEEAANSVGLHLNESKTKYLSVKCEVSTTKPGS